VKKFFKWMGIVVAGLAGLLLLGYAWIFFASERELARRFTHRDDAALVIPTDAVSIAEGQRIAQLAGCQHCHGENLSGALVDEIPNFIRLVASNASVALPAYSDTQLATILRKGVKPDGQSVKFMPSEMFRHLGDEDLARLIAWLRTVPATPNGVQEKTRLFIIGRALLAKGDFKTSARAIETLPPAVRTFDAGDPVSHGRYLTGNYCTECHGQNLEGFAPINSPALSVVKGYSLEQFSHLMLHGVALGDRQLKLMSPTSKARFSRFTPQEIAAVHAYLQSL
jgi:mono/diheme cytochrome c family protein